jgi:hypothetical protein
MANSSTSNKHEDARRDPNGLMDPVLDYQDPILDYIVEVCSHIISFVKTVRVSGTEKALTDPANKDLDLDAACVGKILQGVSGRNEREDEFRGGRRVRRGNFRRKPPGSTK